MRINQRIGVSMMSLKVAVALTAIVVSGCNGSNSSSSKNITNKSINQTNGSVSLEWDIPTSRENQTALSMSEIERYELRVHEQSNSQFDTINIKDASANRHTINDLKPGNYEFTIAVIDTNGQYSEFSDPQYKQIN